MTNQIKKLTYTFSLSLAVLMVTMMTNPAYAEVVIPGQACQPANLTQALNLGLGWDQRGVRNTSPLDGGSFFVVCPLIHDDDEDINGTAPDTLEVEVQYFQDGAIPITCIVYEVDITNTNDIESATNFPFLGVPPGGTFPKAREVSVNLTALAYIESEDHLAVVCALHPQTQIGAFRLES